MNRNEADFPFPSNDPDELRRLAKRARRTAKHLVRRFRSGRYAETVKTAEDSALRLAQRYEDRADELDRERMKHS